MTASAAPKVALVSAFRDSSATLPAFRRQVEALDWPWESLRIVCVEGDSVDDTRERLLEWWQADQRITILRRDTGRPRYGSVVSAERFATLAEVFNTGLGFVARDGWADFFQFVPSDVLFSPDLLRRLIAHQKDVIAPLFWGPGGTQFYDIWGFTSADGLGFAPLSPAAYQDLLGEQPVAMQTVGGALLVRRRVWEAGVRYTAEDVDRGLCCLARAAGFSVWCDPTTHIVHS